MKKKIKFSNSLERRTYIIRRMLFIYTMRLEKHSYLKISKCLDISRQMTYVIHQECLRLIAQRDPLLVKIAQEM